MVSMKFSSMYFFHHTLVIMLTSTTEPEKSVLHLFVQNTFEPHYECDIIKTQPFHLRDWKTDEKVDRKAGDWV